MDLDKRTVVCVVILLLISLNGAAVGLPEEEEEIDRTAPLSEEIELEIWFEGSGDLNWEFAPEPIDEDHDEDKIEFTLENETDTGLHPEADDGWMFQEWQGLDEEYDEDTGETFFTITEDKNITVVFVEEDEYPTLQIASVWGEGTVEVDDEEIDAPFERDYEKGTEVELSATPDADHDFVDWREIVDTDVYETFDDDREITLVMDREISLTAFFAEHVIELDVVGEGEVKVESRINDEEWIEPPVSPIIDESVIPGESGDEIRLTAEPSEGFEFRGWDGYEEDEKVITFTSEGDIEITAVFQEDDIETYEVTLIIDGPGTVEYGSDKTVIDIQEIEDEDEWVFTVEEGTEFLLKIEEDSQEYFKDWTGDYEGEEQEITFTVDEHMEITAQFEEEDIPGFTITILLLAAVLAVVVYQKKNGEV